MSNNPAINVDPLGDEDYKASSVVDGNFKNFDIKNDRVQLDEVVVSPTKTNDGSLNVVQAAQQDIGRNDAQRANTNGAINGMLGSMAVGAAAPLVAIVAMEAAPIMLTSYLANPVTWNSAGSSALLGSTGYGGETPNAGTLEGAAAKTGMNLIPEGKLANHLFKGAGKLADNPTNRTLIQNISNGEALGVDAFGKSWYTGFDAAGKSIYSYGQNGIIKGAGYMNMTPEEMIIKYGLK